MGLESLAGVAIIALLVVFTGVYAYKYKKAKHLYLTRGVPISHKRIFIDAAKLGFIFGAAVFIAEVKTEAQQINAQDVESGNGNGGGGGGGGDGGGGMGAPPPMSMPAMPAMPAENVYQGPVESAAVDGIQGSSG